MRAIGGIGLETCAAEVDITPPRHPAGFRAVCVSVACERFGSYILLSLLLLYLNEHARFTISEATTLLGYFVGLSYLMPLVGGFLADRALGVWGAGVIGIALAATGCAVLLFDGTAPIYAGLVLIAVGTGIFKSSPQALTDRLYGKDNPQRDAGFSSLYFVVNIGALLGPIVGSSVLASYGWRSVFIVAGLGMLVSTLGLALWRRELAPLSVAEVPPRCEHSDKPTAPRTRALVSVCLIALLFTIAQMQTNSTLLLWARDHTDRHVLSGEVPVSYFAGVPALLVMLLSPLLAFLSARLRRTHREPGTATKLRLGMLLTGLAFVPMIAAALLSGSHGRVQIPWLLACLLCLATGELLVSALGPSLVTRLAPAHRRAVWLGCWFGSMALGSIVAGKLGSLWDVLPHAQYFALLLLIPLAGIWTCADRP